MYVNEYTNLTKALEMLTDTGRLWLGDDFNSPSINEQEAYKTVLANINLPEVADVCFLHGPSKRILLRPKVGMGVTLCYPSDRYPYEVVKVVSDQCLEIREMKWEAVPGWVPQFTPGGFVGHIHNLHDQKFTYTSNPEGKVTRIRLNKRGRWMHKSIPYLVGQAIYFRDLND